MIKKKPLVSILINNFNKENFCEKAVKSAINQNYKKLEVIFYDDSSSDQSLNKIVALKKRKKYQNIKIIKNRFRGKIFSYNQMIGINRSLKKSKGRIICLLDSDDWFKKNKIKKVVEFFNKNKNKDILFDKPIFFSTKKTKKPDIKYEKRENCWPRFPPTSCISLRKKSLEIVINKILNKDYPDLWIDFRLASFYAIKKNQFNLSSDYLTYYRQLPNSNEKKYEKFLNFAWWNRRNQAFKFINLINKKNYKKYKTFDFYLTKIIFAFLSFLK